VTIERVGFFHFVESYSDPLGELTKCLEKHPPEAARNSLIVLPEGFNLGRKYGSCVDEPTAKKPSFDARCMLQFLSGIATRRDLAFVVGLIDDDRHNCAYFVDGQPPRLMCQKMNKDSFCEYEPAEGIAKGENPIEVGDMCIGALICIDAIEQHTPGGNTSFQDAANFRRDRLLSDLSCDGYQVLCVPACILSGNLPQKPHGWGGKRVIVANSCLNGAGSFIYDQQQGEVRKSAATYNEVRLAGKSQMAGN
jgi:predicted amidohydrolase